MDTKTWLRERLAHGPASAKDVVADGESAHYSRAAIFRAANKLGVRREDVTESPTGYGIAPIRRVLWSLPTNVQPSTQAEDPPRETLETLVRLSDGDVCPHGILVHDPGRESPADRGIHTVRGLPYGPACWRRKQP